MVAAASPVKTGHHIDYEVREPDSHRLVVAADVRRAAGQSAASGPRVAVGVRGNGAARNLVVKRLGTALP